MSASRDNPSSANEQAFDAITLLTSAHGVAVNKLVSATADGLDVSVAKNSGAFTAETVPIPNLASLADVVRDVGTRIDACISFSLFNDPPASKFNVISQDAMAAALGVRWHKLNQRPDEILGWHEINGKPTICRLKENMHFGSLLLLDRDFAPGMPLELELFSEDDWIKALTLLFPGLEACGRLVVPSTKNRILLDGKPWRTSASSHTVVKVADPSLIEGAWGQAMQRSLLTSYEGIPLAFARPIVDQKHGTGRVLHYNWATIVDRTTSAVGRLIFDGCPEVKAPGVTLAPPDVRLLEGSLLDLDLVPDLTKDEGAAVEAAIRLIKGHDTVITLKREKRTVQKPSRLGQPPRTVERNRVVAVSTITFDLTMDQAALSPGGWVTVAELKRMGATHVRLQSPYRESSSWAAFYGVHADGTPFIFDTGTNEKHVLDPASLAPSKDIIRTWMQEAYQPEHRTSDGRVFFAEHGRALKMAEINLGTAVIERLTMAADAPRLKGGGVNWNKLPSQARAWLPIAWGDMIRALPLEDTEAALATSGPTNPSIVESLKRQLEQLLGTIVPIDRTGMTTERHSLGAWARFFAIIQPNRWRRVGSFALWARASDGDVLLLALRPNLANQLPRPMPEVAQLSVEQLSKRAVACGIALPTLMENNRITVDGKQIRATVLSLEFVAELNFPSVSDDPVAEAVASHMAVAAATTRRKTH